MSLLDPGRLDALVVGVERYAVGRAWDLTGPVADAARMVAVLRRWGVADERIIVLASGRARPVGGGGLDDLGLPVDAADQAGVRAALTRLRQAQQLLVFWGGHGVIDGGNTRRLFYADATLDDKRNLDLTDLLTTLRSSYFPRCERQFVLVDACQNLVEELRLAYRLPSESLPRGAPVTGRQQHVIVAASPGELAANDDRRRTGAFSAALFQELAAGAGPPDPARLHTRLGRRLAAAGETQHPMYLWHLGPHEEGVLLSGLGAARRPARLELRALGAITDVMLDVDELADVPNLRALVRLLPQPVRAAVGYVEQPRGYVISILRTCDSQVDGRAALVAALRLGMADRTGLARVLAALDKHWPAEGRGLTATGQPVDAGDHPD